VRRGEDAGEPRPAVIAQDDRFDATASITICAFTTDPTDAPLFRPLIEPTTKNGLRAPCRRMVDKITTVSKSKIGSRLKRLDDEDVLRLNRAVLMSFAPRASRLAPRASRDRQPAAGTPALAGRGIAASTHAWSARRYPLPGLGSPPVARPLREFAGWNRTRPS
jgi:mRNA interferase MazF